MDAPVEPRQLLIERAREALEEGGRTPLLAGLLDDLFARVPLEDLAAYAPDEIAGFVRLAGELIAQRKPGTAKIDLRNPDFLDGEEVTVVSIVNDNMPFLVDSILGELQDFGAEVLFVAHPILSVERDRAGRLTAYHGLHAQPAPAIRESAFQAHVTALSAEERKDLAARLKSLIHEIGQAVADWQAMLARLNYVIAEYRETPPPGAADDVAEAIAFLEWLVDGNFTFLGLRDYDYVGRGNEATLERRDVAGLGILADPEMRVLRRGSEGFTITPAIREFLKRPEPLIITKSNLKARVHRRAYADYIGVKHYRDGTLSGETRFIGLFTSTAYSRSVRSIPYLRRKVANILARAGFDADSHSGKALVNVLEFYPRDDLFQIDEDLLFGFAMAIMALEERPRVRVLARRDRYDRFVSVLVFVPRDRYDSMVREKIGAYLAAVYDGHVSAFDPSLPEGKLARVHFIIGRSDATATPDPLQAELEAHVGEIVRTWEDEFLDLLEEGFDAEKTERLQPSRNPIATNMPPPSRWPISPRSRRCRPGRRWRSISTADPILPPRPSA
jgi:glutamate dehydrogenase